MKTSFQVTQDPSIAGYIGTSKAGGLKAINQPGLLQGLPADWIKMSRQMSTCEASMNGLTPYNATAAVVVERYMNAGLPYFGHAPIDTYHEGPFNEPGHLEDPVWMKWYGDIEYQRQIAMHNMGYKCSLFAPSSQANIHDKFFNGVHPWKDALLLAKQLGNAYAPHGYVSRRLHEHPELHTLLPHALVFQALGFTVDTIYGEAWFDTILGVTDGCDGWRTTLDQETFVSDTISYDHLLMNYPEVLISFLYIWSGQVSNPDYVMYNMVKGGNEQRATGDILIDYFFTAPWVGRQTPPVDPPPVDPPVDPPTQPGPNLIKNPDFTGGTYAVPGNPHQQVVPNEWGALNNDDNVEIEHDPHFDPPAARVHRAYEKKERGLVQRGVTVEPGATYRATLRAAGWSTTDPSSPFNPSDSPATIMLKLSGVEVGRSEVVAGTDPTVYQEIVAEVVPTSNTVDFSGTIKPVYAVYRTDIRIDYASLSKIKNAPGTTPPPTETETLLYINTDVLNVRSGPGTNHPVIFQVVKTATHREALIGISYNNGWWKCKPRPGYPNVFVSGTYVTQEA